MGAVAVLFLFVIMLLNVRALLAATAVGLYSPALLLRDIETALGLLLLSLNAHTTLIQLLVDISLYLLSASTVSALVYYVNYGAADVMAFATLYSDQGALFLLITAILLIAMLGAIVLATATLDEEEPLSSGE